MEIHAILIAIIGTLEKSVFDFHQSSIQNYIYRTL